MARAGCVVGLAWAGWCAAGPRAALAFEVEHEVGPAYCDLDPVSIGWEQRGHQVDRIARDAVLPLAVSGASFYHSAEGLEHLHVEVRDDWGAIIPGAVELAAGSRVVWRASAALTSGRRYTCVLEADNAGLAARLGEPPTRARANWSATWELDAVDSAAATIAASDIRIAVRYVVVELLSGGDLVCCDGAYPVVGAHGGSLCFEGICGSTLARGEARIDVVLPTAAPQERLANSFVRADPSVFWDPTTTPCTTITVTDLTIGGDTSQSEICFELAETEIGLRSFDPLPRLSAECEGAPYTCEIEDESDQGYAWDPGACTPWDADADGSRSRGCACAAGDPAVAMPLWAWTLLLAIPLRRGALAWRLADRRRRRRRVGARAPKRCTAAGTQAR